jgi:hypothetical protein
MPRPKKDDPRDVNLTIRFSTAEIVDLEQRARAAGCSVAAYTRQAVFGAAIETATRPARVSDELAARELAVQVQRVGVNLNQIVRRMNEDHTPPPRDLMMVLDEIRAYVRQARQLAL